MKKTIRKIMVGLLAFTMMLSAIPTAVLPAQASMTPSDLEGHWAKPAVTQWLDNGLGNGYPDGTFKPNKPVTRAEFAIMANKAFGIASGGKATFTDCKTTDWYYGDLAAAFNKGYISGYQGGSVKPTKAITRQEAAVMLAKLMNLSTEGSAQFTDSAQIPAWASGSAAAVAIAGAMKGYPDGSFKGSNAISRAEAVVALLHATGKIAAVSVTAITCTPGAMILIAGGITGTVTTTITPSNATNQNVTWTSSNTAVATVAAGVVTPIKAGTATITATTVDGSKTAKCAVKVAAGVASAGGGGGGGGGTPPTSSNTFTGTYAGNLTIDKTGASVQDAIVKGDLIVGANLGEGDATLDNVQVDGSIIVKGGGNNSLHFTNVRAAKGITVAKSGSTPVHIVFAGALTNISKMTVTSAVSLSEGTDLPVTAISSIQVTKPISVLLDGVKSGSFELTAAASGATVGVAPGAHVSIFTNFIARCAVAITGNCSITKLIAMAGGITYEKLPTDTIHDGFPAPIPQIKKPVLSMEKVTVDSKIVTPKNDVYTVPANAVKENTAIDVAITDTSAVDYTADISIKKGSAEVAHATASGLGQDNIYALSNFGPVNFSDIGTMLDKLNGSGWYNDHSDAKIPVKTGAFSKVIDEMFARMGSGTYTVTVTLTPAGGSAGSISFDITKAQPAMSIEKVTVGDDVVTPVGGVYTIPATATKANTAIDVTITNTSDVAYAAEMLITNSAGTKVAHATASGLGQNAIDALSKYDAVNFSDIGTMLDKLNGSGWYTDHANKNIPVTAGAFSKVIDDMFVRMGNGVYTVTLTLTPADGNAGSLSFGITKG